VIDATTCVRDANAAIVSVLLRKGRKLREVKSTISFLSEELKVKHARLVRAPCLERRRL
jgi:hypothetical protein